MFACPKGHQSTDPDYCSECGALIGQATVTAPASVPAAGSAAGTVTGKVCPDCGTPRNGSNRFCEVCRFDFQANASYTAAPPELIPVQTAPEPEPVPAPAPVVTQAAPEPTPAAPAPPPPAPLIPVALDHPAVVVAQRLNVEITVDSSLVADDPDMAAKCPKDAPARMFPLDLDENLVGRRSDAKNLFPEIDTKDPGTSHRHMKLLKQADGSFAALELGSSNGTKLNGADLDPGVLTPIKVGDVFIVGAWTKIRVTQR